jgi:hypothetical protein
MNDSLGRRYAFFSINYFVQGAIGISFEPLNYLLKDRLKLSPGEASGFFAWMTLPLLFKPLFGFVTDFVPLGRYRRKPHLVLAAFFGAGAFFCVALQTRYTYLRLLLPMTLSCLALAFADAVCGGLLVEDGKERQQTGPYQAIHIGMLYLSALLVGVGGGWMTMHIQYSKIFVIAGFLPLAIVASVFLIHEPRTVMPADCKPASMDSPLTTAGNDSEWVRKSSPLWALLRKRSFWMLGLTIVLWNFYPFLGTVQFYYQSNALHLNPQWIGSLMSVGSVAGLIGSAIFWKFCRGRDVNSWVSWGPVGMTLVSLTYLFYFNAISGTLIEALFGFASVFFRLSLFDLMTRSCPVDAEATSYALFLTFFDIAMYGSNAVGGKLYDGFQRLFANQAHHDQYSFALLILIGSLCTLACRWTLPVMKESVQTI